MRDASQNTNDAGSPTPTEVRSPLRALVQRWPLALAITLVGAAMGFGSSTLTSVSYTAEARVAVGYGDLTAGAIAGFPLAATELASNYARYVNSRGVSNNNTSGAALTASPIPDSNVIRVEAVSGSASRAVQAVNSTAADLVQVVNSSTSAQGRDSILKNYQQAATAAAETETIRAAAERRLNQAQLDPTASRSRSEPLRSVVGRARSAADEADLRKRAFETQYLQAGDISESADLILVNEGVITMDDKNSVRQRYVLLGGVVGLALAAIISTILDRRRTGAKAAGIDSANDTRARHIDA